MDIGKLFLLLVILLCMNIVIIHLDMSLLHNFVFLFLLPLYWLHRRVFLHLLASDCHTSLIETVVHNHMLWNIYSNRSTYSTHRQLKWSPVIFLLYIISGIDPSDIDSAILDCVATVHLSR